MHMMHEYVPRLAVDVVGRGNHPKCDGDAAIPVVGWRHGRPADVVVSRFAHAPDHPSRGVHASGNPGPPPVGDTHPTAIVEDHLAPFVLRHPDPVAVRRVAPVPRGQVGHKVRSDDAFVGDPHETVDRVLDPRPVGRQFRSPHGYRRGIGVHVVGLLLPGRRRPGRRRRRRRSRRCVGLFFWRRSTGLHLIGSVCNATDDKRRHQDCEQKDTFVPIPHPE